jgi:hypothetical protein
VALRERRALREREAALAKREQELEAKGKLSEADASELAELRTLKQMAKSDPVGYLEAAGLTAQEVFEAVKKGRAPMDPAARQALEEVQRLKKEREAEKAERAKAEEQAGMERFHGHVGQTIAANAAKFPALARLGKAGVADVVDAARAYYADHGKAPPLERVMEKVNAHYAGEFRSSATSDWGRAELVALVKADPKLAAEIRAALAAKPATAPAAPPPPGGLNNTMDAAPPAGAGTKRKPQSLTEELEMEFAEIQAARGVHG